MKDVYLYPSFDFIILIFLMQTILDRLLALVERPKKIIVKFSNLVGKNIKMELGGLDARVIEFIYIFK